MCFKLWQRRKRERKKRLLDPTQNSIVLGRRLWGDLINFNKNYSHNLLCKGKRAAWGLGDSLKIVAGSSEILAAAQTCKISVRCHHFMTFLSLPLCVAWLWYFLLSSCYSPIAEAQTSNALHQICRGVLQCWWRSASHRLGRQREAAIQKCFTNLNFSKLYLSAFPVPRALTSSSHWAFLPLWSHTPTFKILLKRENLLIIKWLGKWLLLNTLEGEIHSATVRNNITCCTASEILKLFLLHRGRNER